MKKSERDAQIEREAAEVGERLKAKLYAPVRRGRPPLSGKRRDIYALRVVSAVTALKQAEGYATYMGREEDVADIRAALLALERIEKMLVRRRKAGADDEKGGHDGC